MAPLSTFQTLHPLPTPSLPPAPTLPILLPPLALLSILLILYIRRPPTLVPTRPMATMKTPLLAGGRMRGHVRGGRRIGINSYGGARVMSGEVGDEGACECCEHGEVDKTDAGPGVRRGRTKNKRQVLVRRDDEDVTAVDTFQQQRQAEEGEIRPGQLSTETRTDSLPSLSGASEIEEIDSDDQGPSTPKDVGVAPIHLHGKNVMVETRVLETPGEERAVHHHV